MTKPDAQIFLYILFSMKYLKRCFYVFIFVFLVGQTPLAIKRELVHAGSYDGVHHCVAFIVYYSPGNKYVPDDSECFFGRMSSQTCFIYH